jgi:hypothetical protein
MRPDEFKDTQLGRWSSHPDWQEWRRRHLKQLARVPLGLFGVLALLALINFGNWLGRLLQGSLWPGILGCLLAAVLGAWLTTALVEHWAAAQRVQQAQGGGGAERIRPDLRIVAAVLVLLCLGPFVVTQWLPGFVRVLAYGGAIGLLAMLVAIAYRPKRRAALRLSPAEGPSPAGATARPASTVPPAWLGELLARWPAGCTCETGPVPLPEPDASPLARGGQWHAFFGGLRPTEDQLRVLDRFAAAYDESLAAGAADAARPGAEPAADLLVHGESGSGRTTTLIACALYAALARGQRVLFVVPDALRKANVRQRIEAVLRRDRLHYYVRCDTIEPAAVSSWFVPDAAIPHILIAALSDVEAHLYGAPVRQEQQSELLRRLVLLLEVVLVDDFLAFEDIERSHLPFFLDKHRLVLEAEQLAVQVVVACARLSELGQGLLATRLFSEKRLRRERSVLSLRPRPAARAWRTDLMATDPFSSAADLAVECLRQSHPVVWFRPGIDESERRRLEADLARRGGSDRVRVLADLDQTFDGDPAQVDAMLYSAGLCDDSGRALRLRVGHDDSVILALHPEGERREAVDAGIVPVILDRSATAVLAMHLRSALRFLRPLSPVHVDVWLQFGVREEELPPGLLEYDSLTGDDRYGPELWPYVALRRPGSHAEPVRLRSLAGSGRTEPGRTALWKTSAGQLLEESDLVHLRELRLVYGSEVFVAEGLRRTAAGVELRAQPWQGNGSDAYVPVWQAHCTLPAEQTAVPWGGGPDFAMAWLEFESPRGVNATLQCSIAGLMTESGLVKSIAPVSFEYAVRGSVLLFQRPDAVHDGVAPALGGLLSGGWSTRGDERFTAALTAALHYAFQARVPGLNYFARTFAFVPADSAAAAGRAVVLLLEPIETGRTVLPVLSRVLNDPRERRHLFQAVQWFLNQLAESKSPERFLRRNAPGSFEGHGPDPHLDAVRELVQAVREAADRQLGAAAG